MSPILLMRTMWTSLSNKLHLSQTRLYRNRNKRYIPSAASLGAPSTEKINELSALLSVGEAGHSSMRGWRPEMEDAFVMSDLSAKGHSLLAVFDGHAGSTVAEFAANNIIRSIEATDGWKDYARDAEANSDKAVDSLSRILVQAIVDLDVSIASLPDVESGRDFSGAAAVVVIISPQYIICANLGDSRCVIRSGGLTISMSEDHKPDTPEERLRILSAGGFVQDNRVDGELAMSRALGDFRYKAAAGLAPSEQKVVAVADISVHTRSSADEILLLACDGVFDVMSNKEAADFVAGLNTNAVDMAGAVVDLAFSLFSTDNISAIVLPLGHHGTKSKKRKAVH